MKLRLRGMQRARCARYNRGLEEEDAAGGTTLGPSDTATPAAPSRPPSSRRRYRSQPVRLEVGRDAHLVAAGPARRFEPDRLLEDLAYRYVLQWLGAAAPLSVRELP